MTDDHMTRAGFIPPGRPPRTRSRTATAAQVLFGVMLIAVAGMVLIVLAGCSSSPAGTTVTSHDPDVQQIGAANGLARVTDCGNSNALFTTDTGIGYRGSVKYGIDTFGSTAGRDAWIQVAKGMGGFPAAYQQGPTWVLYRAEDQSPGC